MTNKPRGRRPRSYIGISPEVHEAIRRCATKLQRQFGDLADEMLRKQLPTVARQANKVKGLEDV